MPATHKPPVMRRGESRHVFQVRDTFPFVFFFFSLDGAWTYLTWPCPPSLHVAGLQLEFASFLANITGNVVIPKAEAFIGEIPEASFTRDNMFPNQHVCLLIIPGGQNGIYQMSVVLVFFLRTTNTQTTVL